MDNAPNNESQEKQTERAADSPLKKLETENVKARPNDVAATAAGREAGLGQAGGGAPDSSLQHAGPPGETNVAPSAIEVLKAESLDDTVDADAKNNVYARDEVLGERNPENI